MDARPNTRLVDRDRKPAPPQPPLGAKQIVIPMTRPLYDEIWHDPQRVRAFLDGWVRSAPELFPAGFDGSYRFHGFGRRSRKLPGLKLRKIVTADGVSYWLRPSFVAGYMTGTVDELAYPLLLAAHGVPPWLLKIGFGHSEMYWYRVVERLGRSSLVGTTVRDPARLPEHLAADEHHADWAGQKGYLATTVGGGCVLGVALTSAADDDHLRDAYGVFAAEARATSSPDTLPRQLTPMAGRRREMPSSRCSRASRWCSASCTDFSRSATAAARPAICTAGSGRCIGPPPPRSSAAG
jgi:hypothetical protein